MRATKLEFIPRGQSKDVTRYHIPAFMIEPSKTIRTRRVGRVKNKNSLPNFLVRWGSIKKSIMFIRYMLSCEVIYNRVILDKRAIFLKKLFIEVDNVMANFEAKVMKVSPTCTVLTSTPAF